MPDFDVRILVLEDELDLVADMKAAFQATTIRKSSPVIQRDQFTGGLQAQISIVSTAMALDAELKSTHYHFVSIDLRTPLSTGTVLTDEAHGFSAFQRVQKYTPTLAAAVYTQYAKEHMGEIRESGRLDVAFWQKSAGDSSPDANPPILKVGQWAERVCEWISPYGPAQLHCLQNARDWIPKPLAETCTTLESACAMPDIKHLSRKTAITAHRWRDDNARDGLLAACRMAEQCKEWLWALFAARVRWGQSTGPLMDEARLAVQSIGRSGWAGGNAIDQQSLKEEQLNQWIALLDEGATPMNPRLRQHLGGTKPDGRGDVPFVAALKTLRETRNKLAHQNPHLEFTEEWSKIALPFWRVLDVVAYFATYPLLEGVRRVAEGNYKAKILDAMVSKDVERKLPHALGLDGDDVPDLHHAYVVWPESVEEPVLLNLSPWVDRRKNAAGQWTTYLYMGRTLNGKVRDLDAYAWRPETDQRTEGKRCELLAAITPAQ